MANMWKKYKGIFITISIQIPSEQLLCAQGLTLSYSEGQKEQSLVFSLDI